MAFLLQKLLLSRAVLNAYFNSAAFSSLLLFVGLWLRSAQSIHKRRMPISVNVRVCALIPVKSNELLLQHQCVNIPWFILCACLGSCTKQCCAQLRVQAFVHIFYRRSSFIPPFSLKQFGSKCSFFSSPNAK